MKVQKRINWNSIKNNLLMARCTDKTSQDVRYCNREKNVPRKKRHKGQNVPRDKTSQGRNVLRKNVPRDKTSYSKYQVFKNKYC